MTRSGSPLATISRRRFSPARSASACFKSSIPIACIAGLLDGAPIRVRTAIILWCRRHGYEGTNDTIVLSSVQPDRPILMGAEDGREHDGTELGGHLDLSGFVRRVRTS